MARRFAYVTDVEGQWLKLEQFCSRSGLVSLEDGRLRVAPGGVFVFGGDAIDRGPEGRKVVAALLEAKRAAPDRVVLIAGNRDINKMRLARELRGHPPLRAPKEIAEQGGATLLSFIFSNTMGAKDAFEHRRTELERDGSGSENEDVVASFLADLEPDGELTRYLDACQLAHREGATLFVHGGVTHDNFGVVPGIAQRVTELDEWIGELNAFYARSVRAFVNRELDDAGRPRWADVVAYQAPLPGARSNPGSVIYTRPLDEQGDPQLPAVDVVKKLEHAGIRRVVVGHTPVGDCPTLLRDDSGFELVIADNSYGRMETGASVVADDDTMKVSGETVLDGNEQASVVFELGAWEASPLGKRVAGTSRLVKARLARGDFLTYRTLGGYEVEQLAAAEGSLASAQLLPPRSERS